MTQSGHQPTIITWTSNLGNQNIQLAIWKARILKSLPTAIQEDIYHNLNDGDLMQAAYIFQNVFTNFPEGSCHIIWLEDANREPAILMGKFLSHYIICQDSGLLDLISGDQKPDFILKLSEDSNMFTDSVTRAIHAIERNEWGVGSEFPQADERDVKLALKPLFAQERFSCRIFFIDKFYHAWTNLHRDFFFKHFIDKQIEIFIPQKESIMAGPSEFKSKSDLNSKYFFNDSGYLCFLLPEKMRHSDDISQISHISITVQQGS